MTGKLGDGMNLSASEFKQKLYTQLKESGIMNAVKVRRALVCRGLFMACVLLAGTPHPVCPSTAYTGVFAYELFRK